MALERAPSIGGARPDALKQYRPPQEQVLKYHVVPSGSKETLASVATANHISVEALVAFNFPGGVQEGRIIPEIVNWYLFHHQGFRCPETADRKNRKFKGGERLAIPRPQVVTFPPMEITVPKPPTRYWVGFGYQIGTTFAVVGNETAQVVAFSVDDFSKAFTATISGSRFPALGWGASGGSIALFMSSMSSPAELRRLLTGDKSYSLTLGTVLKGVLGDARMNRFIKLLADLGAKYGRSGRAAFQVGKQLEEWYPTIVDIIRALPIKPDADEPQPATIALPFGGFGIEASVHFVVSEWHVEATFNC